MCDADVYVKRVPETNVCKCRDETCVWGAVSGYASCATRRKLQTPGTAEEHTEWL